MSQIRLSIVGDCLIEVDHCHVTPSASQVFGLLLLLALRRGKPIGRQEIQQLLLADADGAKLVSHNLRQLLYRVRQLGLRFQERTSGVALEGAEILGPMEHLLGMDAPTRARLTLAELEILPAYVPRLPKPFFTWLDEVKSDIDGQIRRLLLADLETLRVAHAWTDVTRLCETLASLDGSNEEVIRSRAEALAMLGQREEALRVLDQFTRETAPSADTLALLQSVRMRIAKTPIARREGTLRARASCLSFLDGEWGKLASEGARLSAVIGHAGLGKTRVAEEFAARIAFRGGHVVRFECDSQSRQQPLALFSHILPALRAMRGSLGAAPAFKSALALVRPTDDSAELTLPAEHSIESRRAEIQSALIDLLEAVTNERPLLLVVDDAHLLDDASRSVLRALTMMRNDAMLQVLVCARPATGNTTLLVPAKRNSVFELAPLSGEDSAALLLELRAGLSPDDEYVAWSLKQAAGNPFYLHTLASHSSSSTSVPFDISSLALSAYSSLRPDSRTVLESCLLLGRFATIARAMCIAGIEDHALLAALRELEEQDLVHFVDGHLCGPHALLHDALRVLIPSSVSALLHRRIAAKLEEDCVADRFATSLAWASAQSWLAAGDPTAATHLLRRCASHAASLGEPAAGAELLSQIQISALPAALQGDLLDDLARFATAGGSHGVATAALREKLRLARQLAGGDHQIKSLQLRLIEAEFLDGGPCAVAVEAAMKLLSDTGADAATRARAAEKLLVIADGDLDSALAERVHALISTIEPSEPRATSSVARAELMYNTTFGNIDRAYTLASQLLALFREPNTSEDCFRARNHAAFAFYRLGHANEAQSVLEADYCFMLSHRKYAEALYSASLRTDVALTVGDFDAAELWFAKSEAVARGVSPHQLNPNAGFTGNAGLLAMLKGRYDEAEKYFLASKGHYSLLEAARYEASTLAMLSRNRQLRSNTNLGEEQVARLRNLYDRGRSLGSQDPVVEALWCALTLDGDSASASQLLSDYLCVYRRERSLPEWLLRNATAADDAWHAYYSRLSNSGNSPGLNGIEANSATIGTRRGGTRNRNHQHPGVAT